MASREKEVIALVTGGYKNLGLRISLDLKKAGYQVIVRPRGNHHRRVLSHGKIKYRPALAGAQLGFAVQFFVVAFSRGNVQNG